jgi:hypothetical protein
VGMQGGTKPERAADRINYGCIMCISSSTELSSDVDML